ncbi:MAG: hypothetical protein MRZ69_07705 [Lachnospiraceae bacterium]|nr:hypothetical protein [Lachnospiraceae bacterium]
MCITSTTTTGYPDVNILLITIPSVISAVIAPVISAVVSAVIALITVVAAWRT